MTDRPILMSAPMVRAILDGSKTQTRRVVKWQGLEPGLNLQFSGLSAVQSGARWVLSSPTRTSYEYRSVPMWCPYGQPGDRLWVKETWRTAKSLDAKSPAAIGEMCVDAGYRKPWAPLSYEADGHRNSEWRGFELDRDTEPGKTRVSIHMPRWASRITLEVTGVRVERLQDISTADALAEGVNVHPDHHGKPRDSIYSPVQAYRDLWEQINGPGSWDANPWVWCIDFRRVPPLADWPEERKQ